MQYTHPVSKPPYRIFNQGLRLFRMNAVTSAAELDEMGSWDKDNDSWVADYSVVDSFLAEKTPGLTAQQFQENIYAVNYESIKARMQ